MTMTTTSTTRAGASLGDFSVTGLLSGAPFDVSDLDLTYYDLDVSGRWRFLGSRQLVSGSLLIGWRQFVTDFEYDDGDDEVVGDLTFSGPYVGIQINF